MSGYRCANTFFYNANIFYQLMVLFIGKLPRNTLIISRKHIMTNCRILFASICVSYEHKIVIKLVCLYILHFAPSMRLTQYNTVFQSKMTTVQHQTASKDNALTWRNVLILYLCSQWRAPYHLKLSTSYENLSVVLAVTVHWYAAQCPLWPLQDLWLLLKNRLMRPIIRIWCFFL